MTCSYKNGKYLGIITDDSLIICDDVIDAEEAKAIPKNITLETKIFYDLLAFLLFTIALLIAFSFCFCLIKYKSKQKLLICYVPIEN